MRDLRAGIEVALFLVHRANGRSRVGRQTPARRLAETVEANRMTLTGGEQL